METAATTTPRKPLVIYTAIFGKKNALLEPRARIDGGDLVCFSDEEQRSDVWQVRKIARPHPDPERAAMMVKILAHRFLPEYERSVWVGEKILVKSDPVPLVESALSHADMALYDHMQCAEAPRDCIYDELEHVLGVNRKRGGDDDSALLVRQVDAYRRAGYPAHHGLAWTLVMIRRNHAPDVIDMMEDWWAETERWSKRDLMGFNYLAWKKGFRFATVDGDPTEDRYFRRTTRYRPISKRIADRFRADVRRVAAIFGRSS